jgi:hypothetical protein
MCATATAVAAADAAVLQLGISTHPRTHATFLSVKDGLNKKERETERDRERERDKERDRKREKEREKERERERGRSVGVADRSACACASSLSPTPFHFLSSFLFLFSFLNPFLMTSPSLTSFSQNVDQIIQLTCLSILLSFTLCVTRKRGT